MRTINHQSFSAYFGANCLLCVFFVNCYSLK